MTITDRVASASATLTDAERDILTDVLGSNDAAFLSAAEVARRSSVHETTVIRLARKLGYSGYREFRAALRDTSTRSDRLLATRATNPADIEQGVGQYLRDEANAILGLADLVTDEQLMRVATSLAEARRVYVMGVAALVDCLATRLRRVSIDTHSVRGTERQVAERLIGVQPGDVVFAFAIRPAGAMFGSVMAHLRERGAHLVVVTDVVGATFAVDPDELLTVIRGADDNFRTLVVPTALCYAIELALYRVDYPRASESLAELDHIAALLHERPRKKRREGHS